MLTQHQRRPAARSALSGVLRNGGPFRAYRSTFSTLSVEI
jgi:hypothetical protein